MPTELAVVLIALGAGAAAGLRKLLLSMVDRRVEKFKLASKAEQYQAEQDRKDREQKRKIELEIMRRETAKAQADAEEAKATNLNLTNLTSAVLRFMEKYSDEQHATQSEMSNQAQSIGDMAESVDRVATAVDDNTVITRATGKKSDDVVATVNHFYNRFAKVFPSDDPITKLFEDFKREILSAIEERKLTIVEASNKEPPDLKESA